MREEGQDALSGLVELHRDGPVLEIRMVKGPVNAICRRFSRAMEQAALHLQADPDLRVGILTSGCSRAFSAGLDFSGAGEEEKGPGADLGGFGGITRLHALKKPLIAVIGAPAVGGGLELALSCDILLMADDAWLQLPELERGLLPDGGGLQRLPRRIPYHVATAMIWTGNRMTAAEARHWGLVYRTAPRAELMDIARGLAARIARAAPLAAQALKEALRVIDAMPDDQAMALRADTPGDLEFYRRMLASDDMIEGQRAFLEKREPRWRGR